MNRLDQAQYEDLINLAERVSIQAKKVAKTQFPTDMRKLDEMCYELTDLVNRYCKYYPELQR